MPKNSTRGSQLVNIVRSEHQLCLSVWSVNTPGWKISNSKDTRTRASGKTGLRSLFFKWDSAHDERERVLKGSLQNLHHLRAIWVSSACVLNEWKYSQAIYQAARGSIKRKHGRGCTGWKMHPSRVVTQPSLHPANNHHHQHDEQSRRGETTAAAAATTPASHLANFCAAWKKTLFQQPAGVCFARRVDLKHDECLIIRPAKPDATNVSAPGGHLGRAARNKSWSTWRDWNLSRRCRDLSGCIRQTPPIGQRASSCSGDIYLFVCRKMRRAGEHEQASDFLLLGTRARSVSWAESGVDTMATAVPEEIELAPGMLYFQREETNVGK